jgi:hypothetical protein
MRTPARAVMSFSESSEQYIESVVPKNFMKEFLSKRDFVAENIDDDARLTIVTVPLFNRMTDFKEDSVSKNYLNKMLDDGASFFVALRAICDASEELSQCFTDDVLSGESFLSFDWKLQLWLASKLLGKDAVNPIISFHRLSNEQKNELMQNDSFTDFNSAKFNMTTADEMVAKRLFDCTTSESLAHVSA